MQKSSKIILGIDPGTLMMGYGLVAVGQQRLELIDMNTLRMPARLDAYQRLELIFFTVQQLIQTHHPTDFAIEAPFFGKNVQSMLKLGRAQGVAIAAAMQSGIPVTEYAPRKIKQSITGNGNAGKDQVWKMLQQIMQIQKDVEYLDASDALAVAICHHFQGFTVSREKKVSGWGAFLSKNPGRVKGQI